MSIPFCKLPFSITLIPLWGIRCRFASNSNLTSLQLNKVESSCLFHSHDSVRFNPLSPITEHSVLLRSSSISYTLHDMNDFWFQLDTHCITWVIFYILWLRWRARVEKPGGQYFEYLNKARLMTQNKDLEK